MPNPAPTASVYSKLSPNIFVSAFCWCRMILCCARRYIPRDYGAVFAGLAWSWSRYLSITASGRTALCREFLVPALYPRPKHANGGKRVSRHCFLLKFASALCAAMPTIFIQWPGVWKLFLTKHNVPCYDQFLPKSSPEPAICFCSSILNCPLHFHRTHRNYGLVLSVILNGERRRRSKLAGTAHNHGRISFQWL